MTEQHRMVVPANVKTCFDVVPCVAVSMELMDGRYCAIVKGNQNSHIVVSEQPVLQNRAKHDSVHSIYSAKPLKLVKHLQFGYKAR